MVIDFPTLRSVMEDTTLRWDRVLSSAQWIHEGDQITPQEGNRRFDTVASLGGIWWGRMAGTIHNEIERLRLMEHYDGA